VLIDPNAYKKDIINQSLGRLRDCLTSDVQKTKSLIMLQCVEFGHISMDGEKLPDESSDVNRLLTCMHDMKYTCFKFKNYPLIPALTDCIWIVKFKTCYFPEVLKRNTGFFNCKRAFYFIKNSNYKNKGSPTVLCFDLYRSSSGNCR
jgi:hypothetical protein